MADKLSKLKHIFKNYDIRLAYLFGSQKEAGLKYLKGEKTDIEKSSDLDIAVLFGSPPSNTYKVYGNLFYDLSSVFKPFNVDITFLHEVSYLLKYNVITGIRIFAQTEELADEFEEMVMKFASDLNYKRKMFEKDFLEALENGHFEIELR